MRKIFFLSTLFLTAIFYGSTSYSQDFSNKGKDFWVAYGYHQQMVNNSQDMVLYFAAEQTANVTVTIPGLGYSQNYVVPANTTIASSPLPKTGAQDARLLTESTAPENKGIHITSDKPIVAYAHVYNGSVSGATILFPKATLGKEYYSINYTNISNTANSNCWFYVVAADTGTTTVEITPSAITTLNKPANTPFLVTLTQGQVYNVMGQYSGSSGVDLTGSKIQSINTGAGCKRIAVFSGSGRISITCNSNSSSSDNYMVQAFPKTAWGKKFLTVSSVDYNTANGTTNSPTTPNIFRVCVSEPSTQVFINGVVTTLPLINNFYYELPPTTEPQRIEADKPIIVAQYFPSRGSVACGLATAPNNGDGDPEVIYLSPVEQNINKVLWNTNARAAINQNKHYINAVIPNNGTAISSFKLDGVQVPASSFTVHPRDPAYSYIRLNVTSQPGNGNNVGLPHIIESDSGFNAIAYGYGPAESYGYNAGTNIKDIFQFLSVQNPGASVNFPATCKNAIFNFSMTFPYEPTKIQWVFGAALNAAGINDTIILSPVPSSTVVVSGKTLYTYQLPADYKVATVGIYPIKIIASNPTPDGCGGIQEIDFDLQVYNQAVADFNFNTNGCVTSPVTFTNANNSPTPIISHSWNFGDGVKNITSAPNHTYAAAGAYNVKYSYINDIGCIADTAVKIVTLNDPPAAKFITTGTFCPGSVINFTNQSTAVPGGNILWNFGDGTTSAQLNPSHTYSLPGVYTVTLIVTSAAGCASFPFTTSITIYQNPVANFNLPVACLPAGSAQFTDMSTVTAPGTITGWAWNFGDGTTSTLQNPLHNYTGPAPFNVNLVVTTDKGCTNSKTQILSTVYPEPQAAFSTATDICLGQASTFTDVSTVAGSSITNWAWDFGDGNTSALQNPVYTYTTAGTFKVTLHVTAANGCKTVNKFATKTIFVNKLPSADFTTTTAICKSVTATFTDQSVANTGNIVSWQWDFGDGTTSVAQSPSHIFSQAGNYNVKLTVKTDKGCESTSIIKQVVVNNNPVADFGFNVICIEDIAAFFTDKSTVAAGSIASWQWNFGDVNATVANPNTSTLQNPSHQYKIAGPYSVRLIVTSNLGCRDSIDKSFIVNAMPTAGFAIAGKDTICANQPVDILDASTIPIGSLTKVEIFWDYANDPTIMTTDNSPAIGKRYAHNYPEFVSPASKTFNIRYVIYSGEKCISSLSKNITLLATPILQFDAVAGICSSVPAFQVTQAQLASPFAGSGQYSGAGISPTGLFNPAVAGGGAHIIRYTYNGTNGCSNFIENTIEVYPDPVVNAGPDKFVLEGGQVMLTPAQNIGVAMVTYQWSPPTGLNNFAISNPLASPVADITYTLTVTTDKGCTDDDQVFVKVLKTIQVPNIFSPNGDGIHDRWEIPLLESYPGCTIDLYNRYGQLVHHFNGYTSPWDGRVNGKDVPVGTYYYIIDPKNGRNKLSGYVDVIR